MIIVETLSYQESSINLCTITGKASGTLIIVGPSLLRQMAVPPLNSDGYWELRVAGISVIDLVAVSGKVYFKSDPTNGFLPGHFIFDANQNKLIINPYD